MSIGWLLNGLGVSSNGYSIFKLDGNGYGKGPVNIIGPNVYWPSGIKVGDNIHIYATCIVSSKQCVGRWTSTNGLTFSFDSIVLYPITGEGEIGSQTVHYDPDDVNAPFKMWFGTNYGPRATVIKYATSMDGLNWNRINTVLAISESFETEGFQLDNICRDVDGTWRMFYSATNNANSIFRGIEATSLTPDGSFTNKRIVLEPDYKEFNISNTILKGSRYLAIPSTNLISVGHVYVLTDGTDANTQPVVVESILSSTEILVSDNLYVQGTSFKMRPIYARKIGVSSIYRNSNGECRGYATGWSAFSNVMCEYVHDIIETPNGFIMGSSRRMPFKPFGPGNLSSFENPTPITTNPNIVITSS